MPLVGVLNINATMTDWFRGSLPTFVFLTGCLVYSFTHNLHVLVCCASVFKCVFASPDFQERYSDPDLIFVNNETTDSNADPLQ